MEEEVIVQQQIDEPKVAFNALTGRDRFIINNGENDITLVEISGYDLQINFNMEYINSLEDIETAVGGLGEMFRGIILNKLLEHKKQTT